MSGRGPGTRVAPVVLRAIGARASAVAEVAILCWFVGRVCSDRFAWSQFLLWIPTPIALVATLVGLAASWRPDDDRVVRTRRRAGWIVVLTFVSGWFALLEHRLLRRLEEPAAECLVVAHWDVGGLSSDDIEPATLRTILSRLDADVLVLSGTDSTWSRSALQIDEHGWISRGAFRVLSHDPIPPPSQLDFFGEPWRASAVALLDVPFGDGLVKIDIVDLPSDPRDSRRHLAKRIGRKYDRDPRDLVEGKDEARAEPDIVVGDMNMTRGSNSLHRAYPNHHHAYDDGGAGYGASFHRAFRLYHIDHVLLTDAFVCDRYELIDLGVGRHWGQRAWIRRVSK